MTDKPLKSDVKKTKSKKRKNEREENYGVNKDDIYNTYIYDIKRVTIDLKGEEKRMSRAAMVILNGLAVDLISRMADRSRDFAMYEDKSTIMKQHAYAATNSILSGRLREEALQNAYNAVEKFKEWKEQDV